MSRDMSAFTTLDNANMGTRDDLVEWAEGWSARQPEIDALKAEVLKLSGYRDKYLWALEENGSLCAELELLRKDTMKDFSTQPKEE